MPIKQGLKISCFFLFFSFALMLSISAQNYSDSLTIELQNHFEKSGLPGFAVSVVNENRVLYQQGFGFADKENKIPFSTTTVENLGSVSKTVVGLAFIKSVEDGKLSFDTEINDHLPFSVVNPYYPDDPILIRHLVTHTSSIQDTKNYQKSYIYEGSKTDTENIDEDFLNFIKGHQNVPLEDFLAYVLDPNGDWYKKKNYLKAKPGTQNEYANLNAALIALIIENATGLPFQKYSDMKIFTPLKLSSTSWSIKKISPEKLTKTYFPNGKIVPKYSLITYPDGGLYSCVSDLSLYLQEMIKAYSGSSEFLKPELASFLLPGDKDEDRAFWGMGQKSRNIGHGGSDPGVQTDLQFNADSKIGRIIITNVNAEDNEVLWKQYRGIHYIVAKYEHKLVQ